MPARLTVTEQLQNVPMPMPGPSDVYVPMTSALVGTHSGSGSGSGDGISLPRPTAPSATTSSQLPPCLPCLHAPPPLAVTHGLGWHALVCPPSPAVHVPLGAIRAHDATPVRCGLLRAGWAAQINYDIRVRVLTTA